MSNEDYKTRRQTARILKVSEQTLDRWSRQGLIETIKCGPRRVLIPTSSIEKLLARREEQ